MYTMTLALYYMDTLFDIVPLMIRRTSNNDSHFDEKKNVLTSIFI